MRGKFSLKFKACAVFALFYSITSDGTIASMIAAFIMLYVLLTIWGLFFKLLFPGLFGLGVYSHKKSKELQSKIENSITGEHHSRR